MSKRPFVLWLTGESAAGKTSLAKALIPALTMPIELVDGDDLRRETGHTDFSEQGRFVQARFATTIARRMSRWDVSTIVALVSPIAVHRKIAKEKIEADGILFLEVLIVAQPDVISVRMSYRGPFLGQPIMHERGSPDLMVDSSGPRTSEECALDVLDFLGTRL